MIGPFPPTVGGITSYMINVINSPLNKKFKFIPFTISRPTIGVVKEGVDYSIIKDINLITLLKSILITSYHLIKYPFTLLVNNPKLVHIHTTDYFQFWENYLHIIISKIFRKKIILHIHATSFPEFYENSGRFAKSLIENGFSLIDTVVLLSKNQKIFFEKIISEEKIEILPNFVNMGFFNPEINNSSKNNSGSIDVVFIGGEESKRKGIYDVIKSISLVIKDVENINFVFIGRCNTDKVLNLIKKGSLDKFVSFKGYLSEEEKRIILSKSEIFVLPSYAEGLPIAILEAMSSGLAIISTKVGSIPETIKEGVNGYLISPGDYEELSKKIILLAKNKELLEKIRSNNVKLVEEKYDTKVMIHKIERVYSKLIDSTKK
jgi:glycosyltransferase involved in cell wall biosynthesis